MIVVRFGRNAKGEVLEKKVNEALLRVTRKPSFFAWDAKNGKLLYQHLYVLDHVVEAGGKKYLTGRLVTSNRKFFEEFPESVKNVEFAASLAGFNQDGPVYEPGISKDIYQNREEFKEMMKEF